MIDVFTTVKEYLPKFLSPEQKEDLFKELKNFPNNIDQRFYTNALKESANLFQGDGIPSCKIFNLPSDTIAVGNGLVISNTCDISPENSSVLPSRLAYCPIILLEKLQNLLTQKLGIEKTSDFIKAVKAQRVTSMFYLPACEGIQKESIALLDQPLNSVLDPKALNDFCTNRLFTLSNYGFYLFLFKFSIHFTRIMDGVDRNNT